MENQSPGTEPLASIPPIPSIPPMEPGRFHDLMARRTLTISISVDTLARFGAYALGTALMLAGYVLIGYAETRGQE